MKKIFIYTVLLLCPVIFSLTGCYKDKGNYDYKELTSLVIDTTGGAIKPEMMVKQQARLVLKPDVKYAGNPENLEYKWELYETNPARLPNDYRYPVAMVLSDQKELDVEMNVPATKYYLTYSVTDKTTGTKEYLTITVEVESAISKGWLVLDEKEGSYDMAIIRSALLLPILDPADDGSLFNIFSIANGSKMTDGKFIFPYFTRYSSKVFVFTENSGFQLNSITLKSEKAYAEFFHIPEPTLKPEAMGTSFNNTHFLINNGDVQNGSNFKFSGRLRGDYKAAPFVLSRNSGGPVLVIYDTKNRRFMQLPLFGKTFGIYETAEPDAIFDMNHIGMDLLYMENGFNSFTNSVFKDPGTGKYFLYVADLNQTAQTPIAKYEMNNCPDIGQATQFAFGSRGQVGYYGAGNKVYFYDYSRTNTATIAYTFDASEKITSMKVFKQADHANDSKVLVVATYNETSKAGKVYLFEANEVSGTINTASKKEYSGFGRIVDMSNKQ